jgi:hypothetical protein
LHDADICVFQNESVKEFVEPLRNSLLVCHPKSV